MDPFKKLIIRILSRPSLYEFNLSLFRRVLRGLGLDDYGPIEENGELNFLQSLARRLPPTPVIFDVGAHTGLYARTLRRLRPDAQIFAFEPGPPPFARLVRDAEAEGYQAFNLACGETRGEVTLYDYADAPGSEHASVYREVFDQFYRRAPVARSVPMIRLDDFTAEKGITRIDFLKIDTEGSEVAVLRGLGSFVASGGLSCVQLEFGRHHAYTRTLMRDYWELLPGYTFYRIVRKGLVPLGSYDPLLWEIFAFQNVVALSPVARLMP